MKNLNNTQLISELKNLCKEERKLTAQVLDYLREVERRKLFLEMGYNSLYEFCIKELQYSEGSAQRRISSMRLLRELPEIEEKIVSGKLSLSVVSQAQSFFKKQKEKSVQFKKQDKLELLAQLENASSKECERTLLTLDPEPIRKDQERPITEELTEIRLTVKKDFTNKLDKLKNLYSNSNPNITTQEIIQLALVQLLKIKDPASKLKNKQVLSKNKNQGNPVHDQGIKKLETLKLETEQKQEIGKKLNVINTNKVIGSNKVIQQNTAPFPPPSEVKLNRYIPSTIKQEVWFKSEGQCCYKNPKTGQRCTARRFLHYDHIVPLSKDGKTTVENIQLLCSNHNLWKSNRVL